MNDFHANADDNAPDATPATLTGHSWMRATIAADGDVPVVDANQLTSLSAMIAYVAAMTTQSEFRLERKLADRFNIPNVKCLPMASFDDAIRFLVDSAGIA